jgi:hypothetical protein
MPIEEVFEQWRKLSGSSKLAEQDLRRFVRGECPSLEWRVYPNGEVIHLVRSAEDSAELWRDFADLSVTTKLAGDDCLAIHFYRHPSEDDVRVSFFLRVADVKRELECLYPTTAVPPPVAQAPIQRQAEDKGPEPPMPASPPVPDPLPRNLPSESSKSSSQAAGKKRAPRPNTKYARVYAILGGLDQERGLRDDLQPHEIEKLVKAKYKPKEETPSRRHVFRVYTDYLTQHP